MDPATIDRNTFKLVKLDGLTPIAGDITHETATKRACFQPAAELEGGVAYRATITGVVKDRTGNAMAQEHAWTFTVA